MTRILDVCFVFVFFIFLSFSGVKKYVGLHAYLLEHADILEPRLLPMVSVMSSPE
jgi:hypothetical protein